MDGKRRGRAAGFLNGKVMRWSLYRATTSKAKPITSTDQGHLRSHQTHKNIIVNQDQVIPQLPTHATSLSYYPPTTAGGGGASYSATKMDDAVYGGIAVDEEIDRKAANYISSVRERAGAGLELRIGSTYELRTNE
nr:hypothetical protein Ccrd_019299 [Ipomoea batatas]